MATALSRFAITAADRAEIARFRASPTGYHPPGLTRLLNRMRGEDIVGKYVLVNVVPHREWVLAELQGRGRPPKLHGVRVTSLEQGEWEIFRRRWYRYTGEELEA
jgi:hypothetical protein